VSDAAVHPAVLDYFARRGWTPFKFQMAAWRAYLDGRGGLINAPTGLGKTMAAWLGPVIEALNQRDVGGTGVPPVREPHALRTGVPPVPPPGAPKRKPRMRDTHLAAEPVRVIWVTPLRALASDTTASLLAPIEELGLNWTVQMRTGDTAGTLRKLQRERLPTALVTTPESLTLFLSYPDWRERFGTLRCVVTDEWHELMGTKRGVQVELALARLRTLVPGLRTWGVSATLGNLPQARDTLLGSPAPADAVLIRGQEPKSLAIETLIPRDIERFPWAGHLGTRAVGEVIEAVQSAGSTLLFTNTRAQAELWFRRLLRDAPDLVGQLAIHHGSLDRKLRTQVEGLLADGRLKCVVCTSSLDLGVDFTPVDQVIQVGSPKGVARLMQRAGRSGHRPGARSRVLGVPTHAFELVEFCAAREAAQAGHIEARPPLSRPLDVLVQHLVTVACAAGPEGFDPDELVRELRSTHAYSNLTDEDWTWALDFVRRGGPALTAYPHFARVRRVLPQDQTSAPETAAPAVRSEPRTSGGTGPDVRYTVADDRTARFHRMAIGTITADSTMSVKYLSGKTLGNIEEGFIARLEVGARFVFAGKVLEILKVKDMTVFVRRTTNKSGIVPRWDGSRFSLSTQLADAVRRKLDQARDGLYDGPEMESVRPLLQLQQRWSLIPRPGELLFELIEASGAHNTFLFPFEGRLVHEGLGALLSHRLARRAPLTISASASDYGLVLRSADPIDLPAPEWRELLSTENLIEDLVASMNSSGLARRQFRDIARVAGLIMPGMRGAQKPMRHVQASSEMFFDVFEEFDPGNLLLHQARREVLESQLEFNRMKAALERMAAQRFVFSRPVDLTPMAFPLWAEHLRSTSVSTEKWADLVAKMALELEQSASGEGRPSKESRSRKTKAGTTDPGKDSAPRPGEGRRGRSPRTVSQRGRREMGR
jgi:ATP-dependent Lhr-like helicase